MFLDVKNIKIRRLGKKNKLGRHLQKMQKLFPDEYDFIP